MDPHPTKSLDQRFLIVGLGSAGTRHLNNLHRLGVRRLSALRVVGHSPPTELLAPEVRFFKSWGEAVSEGIDCVVISNPTSLHAEVLAQALRSNCHVYVEKPVAHSLETCDYLQRLALESKKQVLVGCQLRWHPHFLRLRQWLQEGELGDIQSVFADMGEYLPDWHPWEDYRKGYAARSELGGGVILTQIHDLDYLYSLFGPFESIYAIGGKRTPLQLDVEDTALISIQGRSRVPIQLRMDYWRSPPVRKLHVVGQEGELTWDYSNGTLIRSLRGKPQEIERLPGSWDRNQLFLDAMTSFLKCIDGQEEPRIPLSEGIELLRIALAAKSSLISGHEVTL